MAKLKISRIEIASAVSDSEEIVNLLQRFGCMEISVLLGELWSGSTRRGRSRCHI